MVPIVRATLLTPFLAIGIALAGTPDPAASAEATQHVRLEANELLLADLIGKVHVTGHAGPAFEIDVTPDGRDAASDPIRIETKEGDRAKLLIRFPVARENHFVYPEMGRGSSTTISVRDTGEPSDEWLGWVLPGVGGHKVVIHGRGKGLEVWADVTVKVPEGKDLEVRLGVGTISAQAVKGNLVLDTHSGPVEAHTIAGSLDIDTGSGSVTAEGVQGDVKIDTGSGSVELLGSSGQVISIDTGSGSVRAEDISCKKLTVDTGSGDVVARSIGTDDARIDTGSGSVEFALVKMGTGRFLVDTGSGGIDLRLPADASARIAAETGGGSVRVNLPNARIDRESEDEVEVRVGAGEAEVRLDAGSGRIRISS